MHAMIFIPATVFCAVAVICSIVCTVIDARAARAAQLRPAASVVAAPRRFRPVVIEGGLKSVPAPAYLRPAQRPLRLAGAAAANFGARSYGG